MKLRQVGSMFISTDRFLILFFAETKGIQLRCTKAFSHPITNLIFLNSDSKTFVVTTNHQLKIFDFEGFVKKREFIPTDNEKIISIKFIPKDDRLFVVLYNNIICILTSALKLIRHFDPLKARQKYLQKTNNRIEKLNYNNLKVGENGDIENLIKTVTRDHSNGIVVDVSFSDNGNSFCVSFADNVVVFFSTSLWDVRRVIKFPDFYIKQCSYISTNGGYNPNILMTATSNDDVMLIDLKDLNSRMLLETNDVESFAMTRNGKILFDIQKSGDIFVYTIEDLLKQTNSRNMISSSKCEKTLAEVNGKGTKPMNVEWNIELEKIQMKVT